VECQYAKCKHEDNVVKKIKAGGPIAPLFVNSVRLVVSTNIMQLNLNTISLVHVRGVHLCLSSVLAK